MKAFMEINDMDFNKIKKYMTAYTKWVLKAQAASDPNSIDVRIEPKFRLPNGEVYNSGWCRPQTDGPALRANTLMMWARVLIANGKSDFVTKYLWNSKGNGGAIKNDLDWVVNKW